MSVNHSSSEMDSNTPTNRQLPPPVSSSVDNTPVTVTHSNSNSTVPYQASAPRAHVVPLSSTPPSSFPARQPNIHNNGNSQSHIFRSSSDTLLPDDMATPSTTVTTTPNSTPPNNFQTPPVVPSTGAVPPLRISTTRTRATSSGFNPHTGTPVRLGHGHQRILSPRQLRALSLQMDVAFNTLAESLENHYHATSPNQHQPQESPVGDFLSSTPNGVYVGTPPSAFPASASFERRGIEATPVSRRPSRFSFLTGGGRSRNNSLLNDQQQQQQRKRVRFTGKEIESVVVFTTDDTLLIKVEYARPAVATLCVLFAVLIAVLGSYLRDNAVGTVATSAEARVDVYAYSMWRSMMELVCMLLLLAGCAVYIEVDWEELAYLCSFDTMCQLGLAAAMYSATSLVTDIIISITRTPHPYIFHSFQSLFVLFDQLVRGRVGVFLGERVGVIVIVLSFVAAFGFEDIRMDMRIQGNMLALSASVFLAAWLQCIRSPNQNLPLPLTLLSLVCARFFVTFVVGLCISLRWDTDPTYGFFGFVNSSTTMWCLGDALTDFLSLVLYLNALRCLRPLSVSCAMCCVCVTSMFFTSRASAQNATDELASTGETVVAIVGNLFVWAATGYVVFLSTIQRQVAEARLKLFSSRKQVRNPYER